MKRHTLIFAVFSFFSMHAFAGGMRSEDETEPCWGPSEACSSSAHRTMTYNIQHLVAFSIAPAWSNNGQTQTLTLQPGIQKKYQATFKNNVFPYGELFFGMQKQLNKSLFAQLGLELGAGGAARFRGDVWENADPNLINYTYSYNVNQGRVLAKFKLLADINFYDTRPFVNVGLGAGFNHAYNFNTQPVTPKEVLPSPFNSKTITAFAYTLGFGFEEVLNERWHTALSYEFANWGQSQLAAANGQTIGEGLVVNNIYINSVFLTLIYVT